MRTEKTRALPAFYTQGIGSLPRPRFVLDLLAGRHDMQPSRFAELMDEVVVFAVRMQEVAGMDVVTDGEWRRAHYVGEFLERIGGFKRVRPFRHQGERKLTEVVVRRIGDSDPVFAAEGRFLASHTDRCTKFALPSPYLIGIRYWHRDYSADAYPTMRHFVEHLSAILRREAEALVEAGIDIIQIDDPALTYFCDPRLTGGEVVHDERLNRRWDADVEVPLAVEALNHVVTGLSAEVQLHCCHSVYKRRSDVIGNYKPLLPRLTELKVDRLNLEFA